MTGNIHSRPTESQFLYSHGEITFAICGISKDPSNRDTICAKCTGIVTQSLNVLQIRNQIKTEGERAAPSSRDLGMAEPASQGLFNFYDSNDLITFTSVGR